MADPVGSTLSEPTLNLSTARKRKVNPPEQEQGTLKKKEETDAAKVSQLNTATPTAQTTAPSTSEKPQTAEGSTQDRLEVSTRPEVAQRQSSFEDLNDRINSVANQREQIANVRVQADDVTSQLNENSTPTPTQAQDIRERITALRAEVERVETQGSAPPRVALPQTGGEPQEPARVAPAEQPERPEPARAVPTEQSGRPEPPAGASLNRLEGPPTAPSEPREFQAPERPTPAPTDVGGVGDDETPQVAIQPVNVEPVAFQQPTQFITQGENNQEDDDASEPLSAPALEQQSFVTTGAEAPPVEIVQRSTERESTAPQRGESATAGSLVGEAQEVAAVVTPQQRETTAPAQSESALEPTSTPQLDIIQTELEALQKEVTGVERRITTSENEIQLELTQSRQETAVERLVEDDPILNINAAEDTARRVSDEIFNRKAQGASPESIVQTAIGTTASVNPLKLI